MGFAASGGVSLYYEETGKGFPLIFVHEFAGGLRSWEPQLRYFSRRYRCIAFNARGYPPSSVPPAASKYSQTIATADIASVMRHLKLRKAHIVGCSMGAYATLHFGLTYPHLARSITVVGVGYGSEPRRRRRFLRENALMARRFHTLGTAEAVKPYQIGAARVQFQNKDPRGFEEFCEQFAEHSALGAVNTLRGVQARRPTVYSLDRQLRKLKVPMHVITGDEDDNALEPSLYIKRICPAARLSVVAATGHAANLEEPDLFNRLVLDFLTLVDGGRWRPRDPRSLHGSLVAAK